MSDAPRLVPETTSRSTSAPDRDFSPSCPFCAIANTYQPISPLESSDTAASQLDPEKLDPPSFVLYSSEHVVAFLDLMPLTRGHVLVAPRKHRVKIGDLSPDEGAEVCFRFLFVESPGGFAEAVESGDGWGHAYHVPATFSNPASTHTQIGRVLPLLTRSVLKAVLPDITHEHADYNVVQNNGPGAAQVVPHVHFHIVPRPPLNYKYPPLKTTSSSKNKYPPNPQPAGRQATAILFGRGMREDLDWDEATLLAETMRAAVKEDWKTTFPDSVETGDASANESRSSGVESSGDGGYSKRGKWKV
ncbi:hypothetical protein H2200_008042 [Cladophialophora chaetospira]|uniref:HIT domain-containing protein n=1 Tax=Cladophialophora chaetospira TaxID=386627 RepID=A0AA39CH61_9EURO|nr:hypothetical protein H2200_008042 [Cladophialophora chaetospira]